jgi:hypothetical protein
MYVSSMTKTSTDSEMTKFAKKLSYDYEYEVWVLGTWEHETGHATVVFTGNEAACVTHRVKSEKRSTLSVRPTGRIIPA